MPICRDLSRTTRHSTTHSPASPSHRAEHRLRSIRRSATAARGLLVQTSPDAFTITPQTFSTFSRNNFYGNDRKRPTLFFGFGLYLNGFNPGPSAHCGVLNVGPLAALFGPAQVSPVPATQLEAVNNY